MRTLLALTIAALLTGTPGAAGTTGANGASASGLAVEIDIPGQQPVRAAEVAAPPDAAGLGQAFSYPADGSVVQTQGITASAQSQVGAIEGSSASADVSALTLFAGDVTADLVSARAEASAGPLSATGDVNGSTLANLVVLGQPVVPKPNLRVPLADWGYATVLEQAAAPNGTRSSPSFRGFVAALDVHLTAAHGGLPADSEVLVGYAEATAQSSGPAPKPPAQTKKPAPAAGSRKTAPDRPVHPPKNPKAPKVPKGPASISHHPPPGLQPRLTGGRYVFPVYGAVSYVDTFGAPRADVSYHHGDDIFAPLGTPLLAVADGRVFSVGWNNVGGNRLWLQDGQGNQFYYAHLAAFAPAARNGKIVKAGTVLGFVGNTGDAEATPYHLHFEVHPVSLLYLDYDGAVDPTPYLRTWTHLRDVSFTIAEGWVPPARTSSPAPKPGAFLMAMRDISGASGLDPGALERAFVAPVSAEGDGGLVRAAAVLGGG